MSAPSSSMLCRMLLQVSCGPAVCVHPCSDRVPQADAWADPMAWPVPAPGHAAATNTARAETTDCPAPCPLPALALAMRGRRERTAALGSECGLRHPAEGARQPRLLGRQRQVPKPVVRRHHMSPIAWGFRRERNRARTTLGLAPPSLPFPLPTALSAAYTTPPRRRKAGYRPLVASC